MRISDFPEHPDLFELAEGLMPPQAKLGKYEPPDCLAKPYVDKLIVTIHGALVWFWSEDKTELEIVLYYCMPFDEPDIIEAHILFVTVNEITDIKNLKGYYDIRFKSQNRNNFWRVSKEDLDNHLYSQYYGQKSVTHAVEREAREHILEHLNSVRFTQNILEEEGIDLGEKKLPARTRTIFTHLNTGENDGKPKAPKTLKWHFEYGLNMNGDVMREKVGDYLIRLPAELRGYKLVFSVIDAYNPYAGLVNLEEAKGGTVWGMAYLLTEDQIEKLEASEYDHFVYNSYGFGNWYDPTVGVYLNGYMLDDIEAFFGDKDYVKSKLKPTRAYLEQILAGCDDLPEEYVKKLRKTKTFD